MARTHVNPGSAALLCAWLAGLCGPAAAGVISGTVKAGAGQPVAGAMVTVSAADGRSETVYTAADGSYRLDTALGGELALQVRKRYFRDDVRRVSLGAETELAIDTLLEAITDPKALSDDHPSLSHFARIQFDPDPKALFSRANFTRDCLSCHSLGNEFTRWQRPAAGWVPTVQRMHGYLADATEADIIARSQMLADAFDDALVSSRPQVPYDPALASARILRWALPKAVVPHDAEFDPRNGNIYTSEMFAGEIIEIDIRSGRVEHFKLPADGEPPGGAFTRMGLPSPYGLTVSRAPHSLAQGHDGRWYMSDSIGSAITAFDPATRAFQNYPVGGDTLYPHTVRVDDKGRVWFTISFSNHLGRLDPASGEMKVIALPDSPTLSTPGTPVPYGIDVHPRTGEIWYAKLASDKIGRVDPETMAVTEFDSPVLAPRRQRFDAEGMLWVAGFSDGTIARIDTDTMATTIYPLPVLAEGEVPAPYALAVHPDTGDIWINDTMMDVAWRFIPAEERFITYPLPLRGTYTRDFTFTDQGWACTSNNPIPAAALEGGVPELICIDAGDAADATLVARQGR